MIGERVGGTTYGQELAVVTVLVGLTAAVVTLYSKQNDPTVPSLFFLANCITVVPEATQSQSLPYHFAWLAVFLVASSFQRRKDHLNPKASSEQR